MDRPTFLRVIAVVLVVLLSGRWLSDSVHSHMREKAKKHADSKVRDEMPSALNEQGRREYVLEVIGLGVTFEKYRQGSLWTALQGGNSFSIIREKDPKKYPWQGSDKLGVSGSRACDALENGAGSSPMYWGIPSFYAGGPGDPAQRHGANNPVPGLTGGATTTGMAWHLFVIAPWRLEERPDRLLEQVFSFFDANPDVPYIVVAADDSSATRDEARAMGSPAIIKDGYYIPEMPDSTALFVLARRERVEPLRPYVWTDPQNDFVQTKLRMMYYEMFDSLPTGGRWSDGTRMTGRPPSAEEWLPAAAAFARRPEVRGEGLVSHLNDFNPLAHRPPKDWKPTPWFPIPWNTDQMETFDRLPSLGFIHRPTFVKFVDDQGKPVTRHDARQAILDSAWQEALKTLPESERGKGPARVIAATGNKTEQILTLEGMLSHYARQGGPQIDTSKPAQFINTDRRLGNTGAATFFMQMAIGVMGSYREGGASAAINFRDPMEASIIFITPPSEEKRKSQQGDVFRHRVGPAIDPDNYKPPAVAAGAENHTHERASAGTAIKSAVKHQ